MPQKRSIPLTQRVPSLNRAILATWLFFSPATGRIGGIHQVDTTSSDTESDINEMLNRTKWAGYQLHPPQRRLQQVHNYCGSDWTSANSQCTTPCPDGESTWCPGGESCFADVTSCPGMIVGATTGDAHATMGSVEAATVVEETETSAFHAVYNNMDPPPDLASPSHCPQIFSPVHIGYYQSWARYRSCHPVSPSSIPTAGLSHLIYSFAGINRAGKLDAYNGVVDEFSAYTEFNSLKNSNGRLQTLIAVGGWTFDQSLFTAVASTEESRSIFASSCVEFMNTHGFDGVDIDWEYPVSRQGMEEDYTNLVLLIKTMREVFGSQYLITIAIPANVEKLHQGYDLGSLAQYVDWFHIMSYDIHGAWDEVAGSNTDMPYIRDTVDYLLSYVNAEKLVLGMASYGRSVALRDGSCTVAGCPIDGGAITGCSGELGFLPYFELKESYIDTGKYDSLLFNEVTGSMEMVVSDDDGGKVWVSLDVEQSWKVKGEFANEK